MRADKPSRLASEPLDRICKLHPTEARADRPSRLASEPLFNVQGHPYGSECRQAINIAQRTVVLMWTCSSQLK
ncbi:MAG: hypothetical protein R2825_28165 [Saprospiraceae bacterium]